MNAEPFVGIEDAAKFLGVRPSWLYEGCRLSRVPHYKVGKYLRFRLSELEGWIQRHENGGPGPQAWRRLDGAINP